MSGNPYRFTLTNFCLEDSTQICVIFSSNKPCLLAEYFSYEYVNIYVYKFDLFI